MERMTVAFFIASLLSFALLLALFGSSESLSLDALNVLAYFLASLFLFKTFLNTSSWLRSMMLLLLLSSVLMLTYQAYMMEGLSEEIANFFLVLLSASFISTVLILLLNFEGFSQPPAIAFWVLASFLLVLAFSIGTLDALAEATVVAAGLYLCRGSSPLGVLLSRFSSRWSWLA